MCRLPHRQQQKQTFVLCTQMLENKSMEFKEAELEEIHSNEEGKI